MFHDCDTGATIHLSGTKVRLITITTWWVRTGLILVILIVVPSRAFSAYSGISLTIAESNVDWQFSGEQRRAQVSQIALQVEDKTDSGLRFGLSIGRLGLLINNDFSVPRSEKFYASYLGLQLRQPVWLTEHLSLQALLSYRYHTTSDSGEMEQSSVDWSEKQLRIELLARFDVIRVVPFVYVHQVNGDIQREASTEVFDSTGRMSSGISLDYFVDSGAYIRFEYSTGDITAGYLKFVREY